MKLEEFRRDLQQDPDYVAAEKELKPLLDLADDVLCLRLEKGWSQTELAQQLGTKQSNISRLESGLANPTYKFLQKVAEALNTEIEIRMKCRKNIEFTKVIEVPVAVIIQDNPWEKKKSFDLYWDKSIRDRKSYVVER